MGGMFTFVGSQYRLEVDGQEYFIDLLLFHRRLRCLVAIELEDRRLSARVRRQDAVLPGRPGPAGPGGRREPVHRHHPLQGKEPTIVEYALHDARKPIGVATYQIVKRLPRELKGQLPSPEEIAKLLEDVG